MGLEDILDRNEIVRRIGVLEREENPFVRDVRTPYAITALALVREQSGKEAHDNLISVLRKNHLPNFKSNETFLEYINDEHNWINIFLHHLIIQYAKDVLQIKDMNSLTGKVIDSIYSLTGQLTINPTSTDPDSVKISREHYDIIAAGEGLGIGFMYELIQDANTQFNTVTEMWHDPDNFRNGHAVIFRRTNEGTKKRYNARVGEDYAATLLKEDSLTTQGALRGIPRIRRRNNDLANVVEAYSELDGIHDHCMYIVEWKPDLYEGLTGITGWTKVDLHGMSILKPSSLWFLFQNREFMLANKSKFLKGIREAKRVEDFYRTERGKAEIGALVGMEVDRYIMRQRLQEEYEGRLKLEEQLHLAEMDLALGLEVQGIMHLDTAMIINPISTHLNVSKDVLDAYQDYKKAVEAGRGVEDALSDLEEEIVRMQQTQKISIGVIDGYLKNFKALHELRVSDNPKRNPNEDLKYLQSLVNGQFAFVGVDLQLELEDKIPDIYLTRKVQSAYLELALNAVRHAGATKLLAKTELIKPGQDARFAQDMVAVHIYNNGEGIENPAGIFDKPTGSNHTGLYNAKIRVELNNGVISLEKPDIPGYSTHFAIYLPLKQNPR